MGDPEDVGCGRLGQPALGEPEPLEAGDLEPGPMVVMCGHGERAMTGASLLQRAGHRDVRVLDGGPDDLVAASDRTLV